jgi:hypothetical protein
MEPRPAFAVKVQHRVQEHGLLSQLTVGAFCPGSQIALHACVPHTSVAPSQCSACAPVHSSLHGPAPQVMFASRQLRAAVQRTSHPQAAGQVMVAVSQLLAALHSTSQS